MIDNINLMIEEFYKTFYQIEELELKKDIKCLTMNEYHTIEIIEDRVLPMNELADNLSVTMGTATVTIENLVNKNFVKRERNQEDRRMVFISLTKKGHLALESHKNFHKKMISLITNDLSPKELEDFTSIFSRLHQNLTEALEGSKPQKISDFCENSELKIINVLGSRGIKDFFYNENIKMGTILKLLRKDKGNLLLLIEGKEVEIDKKDSLNLVAVTNI